MKKKIATIISFVISLSMINAFAESDNIADTEPEMNIEVVSGDIGITDVIESVDKEETEQQGEENTETVSEENTSETVDNGDQIFATEIAEELHTEDNATENDEAVIPTEESIPNIENVSELNEAELLSITTPEGDGWSAVASMTEKKTDSDLVIAQGELYSIGGYSETGYSQIIEKYNDTENTWQYVTDVPNEAKGYTAEAVGSKIYIIGGYQNNQFSNAVLVYDLDTSEWSNITNMNKARDGAASAVVGENIYVIGGRDGSGYVKSYEIYNISTDTWELVTSRFDGTMIRYGADAEIVNDRLFVWGGLSVDYQYAGMNMYSGTNFSESQEIVPQGNENITAAWGLDKGLIFVGSGDGNEYSTVQEINVSDEGDIVINDTSFVKEVPRGKYSKCIIYNGYLYSIGGYKLSSRSYMNNVYRYSVYYGDFASGDGNFENVATESGNTLTINAETGHEYVLFINVSDAVQANGYTYNIEFPYDSFTIEDAAAFTAEKDTSTGAALGTDIYVLGTSASGLSFICTENNEEEQNYAKTINTVILKATSSGERTITYSMTKN